MINWTDSAEIPKPATDDKWSHDNDLSNRVLVASYNGRDGEIQPARFARYHFRLNWWNIEGITGGNYIVTHYSEINMPDNALNQKEG